MAPAATPSPGPKGRRFLCDARPLPSSHSPGPSAPAIGGRRPSITFESELSRFPCEVAEEAVSHGGPGGALEKSGIGEASRGSAVLPRLPGWSAAIRGFLRDFAARTWGVTDVPYRTGPIKPLSARGCRVVIRKRKTKNLRCLSNGKMYFLLLL